MALQHNKKLADLLLDNDIGVPGIPHQLLSNGFPYVGLYHGGPIQGMVENI